MVGVLNLVDIALTANLLLIVIFSGYENYIRKIEREEQPDLAARGSSTSISAPLSKSF